MWSSHSFGMPSYDERNQLPILRNGHGQNGLKTQKKNIEITRIDKRSVTSRAKGQESERTLQLMLTQNNRCAIPLLRSKMLEMLDL